MRFAGLAVVAFISLLFASCQKELIYTVENNIDTTSIPSTGNPTTGSSSLVKTYTESTIVGADTFSVKFNLAYDANNRVTSFTDAADPGNKFVYQYFTGYYSLKFFSQNVIELDAFFYIQSNGLIDSVFQYNNTQDTSSEKYLYDSNKRLVQKKEYERVQGVSTLTSTTFYENDNNGNVITEQSGSSRTTYTYSNLLNTLNIGQEYVGKNKNLEQTTTVTQSGVTITANHTYTFDSQNRQTLEKIVYSTGEIATKAYTY